MMTSVQLRKVWYKKNAKHKKKNVCTILRKLWNSGVRWVLPDVAVHYAPVEGCSIVPKCLLPPEYQYLNFPCRCYPDYFLNQDYAAMLQEYAAMKYAPSCNTKKLTIYAYSFG